MITNRRTFLIKPGQMEEIIQTLKDVMAQVNLQHAPTGIRVLTAIYGPFDVLVLESDHPNVAAYEASTNELFSNPLMGKFMETWFTVVVPGGTNEIWEVR